MALSISPPALLPMGASMVIDHSFPSLAMEIISLTDYAGNKSHPNLYSRNLIENISNRTGKAPVMRVGGTSGDHDYYNIHQGASILPPTTPQPPLYGFTLGPTFFESFENFPGLNYTFMVPMAMSGDSASIDAVNMTKAAVEAIGLSHLDSLEIGNEPDLYPAQGVPGKANYNVEKYVKQWVEHAANVNGNITALDKRIYQALTYSSGVDFSVWNTSIAFQDGIDKNENVKSVSFHHYQTIGNSGATFQNSLMNHADIVNGLSQFLAPISYLRSAHPQVPFHLGEVGSDLNSDNPNYIVGGAYGAALWAADYMLLAMSMNVSRVHMQQVTGAAFSAWQPVHLNRTEIDAPHTRGPYYGMVLAADFIGTAPDFRVKNIQLKAENLSAYAGYTSGFLAKIAIINLDVWNPKAGAKRPVQEVNLDLPEHVTTIEVQKLTGPGVDSFQNITYSGIEWTYENRGAGVMVVNSTEILKVNKGTVDVNIQASEAIVVTLKQ